MQKKKKKRNSPPRNLQAFLNGNWKMVKENILMCPLYSDKEVGKAYTSNLKQKENIYVSR